MRDIFKKVCKASTLLMSLVTVFLLCSPVKAQNWEEWEIAYALIEPWTPPRYAVRVLESPKFLHSYRKLEVLNLFTFLEH